MAKSRADINRENIESDTKSRDVNWQNFKDDTVAVGTRLPKSAKAALQAYFEGRGLKLSQGLRMIVNDFMKQERIR